MRNWQEDRMINRLARQEARPTVQTRDTYARQLVPVAKASAVQAFHALFQGGK